ncbi:MAG: PSP1 domain-containing protein [Bacillota bacterium]
MPVVVGVRFKPGGKIYYFEPAGLALDVGDKVIVETARGTELGQVVVPAADVPEEQIVQPLKKVIRRATEKDIEAAEELRRKEREAMEICASRIAAHGLDMHLVDVEYSFDGSKLIFYFTAEGRVDFRELVRDLASIFRTRIELRQIGVRDEAKIMGGLGPCGREVCCKTFLTEFRPVSIKMAKNQNLSLNPTKISGLCGRLMCCLRFECDHYEDAKAQLPEIGAKVVTPEGVGKVVAHNVLKNTISVELGDKSVVEFPPEEVELEQEFQNE